MMGAVLKLAIVASLLALAWIVSMRLPRNPSPLSSGEHVISPRRILLSALAIAFCASLVLLGTEPGTVLDYLAIILWKGTTGADSWNFLDQAARYLRDNPSRLVYTDLFFHSHVKFQYPVTSLLPWAALQQIPGAGTDLLARLANHISLLFLGLTGLLSGIAMRLSWTRSSGRAPNETRFESFALLSGSIACGLLFYPLTRSWQLGQIQTSLSCFAVASLVCWQIGRPRLAGLLLGICCLAKPQWVVALAWGFLHREFAFAAAGTSVCLAGGLLAGWLYGFGQYLDYLPAMSFMSRTGEAFQANQSVNGLLNRLLHNGDNLVWHADSFAPYHPLVHAATLVSAAILLGVALFRHLREPKTEFDLALVLLALTIASPIAWEHHYGLALGLLALVAPVVLCDPRWERTAPWMLGAIWIAIGQNIPISARLADTPFNFLQSHLFFGGLALFSLLLLVPRPHAGTNGRF